MILILSIFYTTTLIVCVNAQPQIPDISIQFIIIKKRALWTYNHSNLGQTITTKCHKIYSHALSLVRWNHDFCRALLSVHFC